MASHLITGPDALLADLLVALGGSGSHLTMGRARLLAEIRNTYGGSASHLTTSQAALLASIVTAAGGSGSALTQGSAQMLQAMSAAVGGSASALTDSQAEMLASIVTDADAGGGGAEWILPGAYIDIDLVGGDPQGRGYVEGVGEVAVDTLLGADPNTDNGVGGSGYDPGNLGASGYAGADIIALIGAARTKLLAGATIRLQNVETLEGDHAIITLTSASGNDLVSAVYYVGEFSSVEVESENGSLSLFVDGNTNLDENVLAFTFVPPTGEVAGRADTSANGSAADTGEMTTDDYPISGDPIVAVAIDVDAGQSLQRITIYNTVATGSLPGISV